MMVGLAAVCIALSGGIGILLGMKQQPGMLTIQTEYGTVLLHNGGEAYIVIGVFAFVQAFGDAPPVYRCVAFFLLFLTRFPIFSLPYVNIEICPF